MGTCTPLGGAPSCKTLMKKHPSPGFGASFLQRLMLGNIFEVGGWMPGLEGTHMYY